MLRARLPWKIEDCLKKHPAFKVSQCHPKCLRACVFVLQFLAFGWRVYRTFRILYRAAMAFQRADIYTVVASENMSRKTTLDMTL